MKNDIVDLEQGIMTCWNFVEDLKMLNEAVLERDITNDDISNILLGIERLYNLKFEKLFEIFETHVKEYWDLKKRIKYWDDLYSNNRNNEEND